LQIQRPNCECDNAKIHLCFMSTFDSVELCKGTMLFHPKLVAPKRLIAKFSVGTSRQLLRHQSTCHSSFNGIQAGSECD
jgi:hypothetical protein